MLGTVLLNLLQSAIALAAFGAALVALTHGVAWLWDVWSAANDWLVARVLRPVLALGEPKR